MKGPFACCDRTDGGAGPRRKATPAMERRQTPGEAIAGPEPVPGVSSRPGAGGLPGFGASLTCLAGDVGGKTAKGVISEGHLENAGNATVV